jgi:hypothetical protein
MRSDHQTTMFIFMIVNVDDFSCVEAEGQFTTTQPKAALRLSPVGDDCMETFGTMWFQTT